MARSKVAARRARKSVARMTELEKDLIAEVQVLKSEGRRLESKADVLQGKLMVYKFFILMWGSRLKMEGIVNEFIDDIEKSYAE